MDAAFCNCPQKGGRLKTISSAYQDASNTKVYRPTDSVSTWIGNGALLSTTLGSYSGTNLAQSLSAAKNAAASYITGKTGAESFRNSLAINSGVGRKKGTLLTNDEKNLYLSWGYDPLDLIPESMGGNSPQNGGVISETATEDGWWTRKELMGAEEKFVGGNRFMMTSVHPSIGTGLWPDLAPMNYNYKPEAWFGPAANSMPKDDLYSEENLDRDVYALFIYNHSAFTEPGGCYLNELGIYGKNSGTTTSSTVQKINRTYGSTISYIKETPSTNFEDLLITGSGNTGVSNTALASIWAVRPAVYNMSYESNLNSALSGTRRIAIVYQAGDMDMSNVVNASDITYIANLIKKTVKPYDGLSDTTVRYIHEYRIADADLSGVTNASDITYIANIIKKAASIKTLYPNL